jgi:hypothetical protein
MAHIGQYPAQAVSAVNAPETISTQPSGDPPNPNHPQAAMAPAPMILKARSHPRKFFRYSMYALLSLR